MRTEMIKRAGINEVQDLVIVASKKNFILDSIVGFLKTNNVLLTTVELNDDFVNDFCLSAKYVLIKAEDFININYGCLVKVKKYCHETGALVIILGYREQIDTVKKIMDADDIIAMEMDRQTDLLILKTKLLNLLFKEEEQEKKKVILAVDDSGMMLRTIKTWFDNDYELLLANSATKAMSMLSNPKPDVILLDYEMPVCSGAQFFQMLQSEEKTRDIPVIFLTAKDDKETVTEVLSLKPAGYILKTTTKEQILSKICYVLSKAEEN